jgi:hypothetical protein
MALVDERALHSMIFQSLVTLESQESGYRLMTEAERDYCLIGHFDAEVRNGGFSQFFTNPYGSTCEKVLVALEKIGASEQLSS